MNKGKLKLLIAIASFTGICLLTNLGTYSKLTTIHQEELSIREAEKTTIQEEYEKYRVDNEASKEELQKTIEGLNSKIEMQNKDLEYLRNEIYQMMLDVSFNPSNVTQPSGATVYHMKKALQDTELANLSETFIEAEKNYGINAYVLAGIVAQESGWGTSKRARNGSNNLTGYAVYENHSRGASFSSWEHCVQATAELLKVHYLNPKGQWHNGYSVDSINKKYSADTLWASSVISIANSLVAKSNS